MRLSLSLYLWVFSAILGDQRVRSISIKPKRGKELRPSNSSRDELATLLPTSTDLQGTLLKDAQTWNDEPTILRRVGDPPAMSSSQRSLLASSTSSRTAEKNVNFQDGEGVNHDQVTSGFSSHPEEASKSLRLGLRISSVCLVCLLIIWAFTGKLSKYPQKLLSLMFSLLIVSNLITFAYLSVSPSGRESRRFELKLAFLALYFLSFLSIWLYLGYFYGVLRVLKGHGGPQNASFSNQWTLFGFLTAILLSTFIAIFGEDGKETPLWWSFIHSRSVGIITFVIPTAIVGIAFLAVTFGVGKRILERVEFEPEFANWAEILRMLLPGVLVGLSLALMSTLFLAQDVKDKELLGNWLFVLFPIFFFVIYGLKSHKLEGQDPAEQPDHIMLSKETAPDYQSPSRRPP